MKRITFESHRGDLWGFLLDPLPDHLPLEMRLAHYRHSAAEAFRRAGATADDEMRMRFLTMAAAWETLAGEIERAMGRLNAVGQGDQSFRMRQ